MKQVLAGFLAGGLMFFLHPAQAENGQLKAQVRAMQNQLNRLEKWTCHVPLSEEPFNFRCPLKDFFEDLEKAGFRPKAPRDRSN